MSINNQLSTATINSIVTSIDASALFDMSMEMSIDDLNQSEAMLRNSLNVFYSEDEANSQWDRISLESHSDFADIHIENL